jgi:ribosomal protein S12 methylthiotransferase
MLRKKSREPKAESLAAAPARRNKAAEFILRVIDNADTESREQRAESRKVSVGLISLGCAKNLVDSEKILGTLAGDGFLICEDDKDAQIVIVNTCSFVAPAREESFFHIRELCRRKESGLLWGIVIAGCMAQQEGKNLFKMFRAVDAVVSFKGYPEIGSILRRILEGEKELAVLGLPEKFEAETSRLLLTPPHYAYLRIAEGCDNTCTFCTIPTIKGRYRSKKPEEVLKEARELASAGVRELILIAQDTAAYGTDLSGCDSQDIAALLRQINGVDGLKWIRLLYANPESVTDALVEAMATLDKVVKYIDVPIQHISDPVLRRMGRNKMRRAGIEKLIRKLRDSIPNICIRTTVIAGFPGETEEEFEELLKFLSETRFERLGAFAYSREKGTTAAKMKFLEEEVSCQRREEVMRIQQEIAFSLNQSLIGRKKRSMIDIRGSGEYPLTGRTEWDAPEIDASIFIEGTDATPGEIVTVEVTGYRDYDLTGKIVIK